MDSILQAHFQTVVPCLGVTSAIHHRNLPCTLAHYSRPLCFKPVAVNSTSPRRWLAAVASSATAHTANSVPLRERTYNVGDFMTRKENLHVVKPTTTVDEALETLVEKRVTGFPVIDDDWKLIGVVSDYDLLALDSISGGGQHDTNMFPDVDSSWKTFNEIQKLLNKTYGKVVGDLMTDAPLVVRENTNLEDAVRLLLLTKYHRLPVVDGSSKLVGIITRGDVVRAALQIKRASEKM
ncbi:CBS domain-containing CBSX1, chloroplastic-like [Olea europaea subsp. europaea]|uniref:CBS domain-containing CBSX1, chloroplastic-like n=1 Tax=Olea europaea subsp. europaea TaxID=158383 RepID=A0A8S0PZW4_OLEEU|nr:CBS domain-containing CBSX1, chloroplastic-like [Olea europaea subsp. europaea]